MNHTTSFTQALLTTSTSDLSPLVPRRTSTESSKTHQADNNGDLSGRSQLPLEQQQKLLDVIDPSHSSYHAAIEQSSTSSDIESFPTSAQQDPLFLRKSLKSAAELAQLRKTGPNGRKLSAFYEAQNELIEELLSPVEDKSDAAVAAEEERLLKLKIAVYGSLGANVFLFCLQLAAAILSGSLALFATMADAFMDLASSIVLVYAGHAAAGSNEMKYPTGKAKFETAGIIVFSSLMATVSVQLIVESCRALASNEHSVDLNYLAIGCVCIAIGVKFVLYLYCQALSSYPSAKILAQDHRNDLGVNSLGILMVVLGSRFAAWLDPVGAIIIALIILRSWVNTAYEHIQMIVGTTASPAFLQRLTYLALTHDPRVQQVDTCRAYNAGSDFWVEVDIVLPPDMVLAEAHDIGEALQMKLEQLPNVERAFVHLDFETEHKPEHRKSK
ncbi:hypothetical protein SmJEL517_g00166 [Synchytrium microbalum]|uniref:Uncharacterized protein n=1 Tax=Synchytrium microbalum TaxID=1806994 RepID=A0A507CG19_9FUNG|nr:uncharacterized protein SmJEL517_g00166 [Synchytrium microbalum]TPX38129.1 hypothetical protein SmJEL517_g00166 [Synchytrium microbalum]